MGRITFRRKDGSTVQAAVASGWALANVTEEYAADDLRKARQEVDWRTRPWITSARKRGRETPQPEAPG